MFVLRAAAVCRTFDRERHQVPLVLVQLVGGQVDRLRARPVGQLERDRPGRVHVPQAASRGRRRIVLVLLTDVRQEATTVVYWFGHLMVVHPEFGY